MLQTVGPNIDPKITFMIMADIARLRKMPDLAKRLMEYEPQPDPMAVKKAELELTLLQAQIQKEQALAQVHGADANLDSVKAITEESNALLTFTKVDTEKAKARYLNSDADDKDLTYVEQESGVKQERDLEKIRGQAEAQARTKIIEAMLRPKPAAMK